jgi:hypothetical protein
VLAAVGSGWFDDVATATEALVRIMPSASPGPASPAYADAHAAYRELYPALAPVFHRQ